MTTKDSVSKFVWHDCLTPDIDHALEFFSKLTDWDVLDQTSPNVGRYPIIKNQGRAIAGILEMPKFLQTTGIPPYWTGYVHTKLERAEKLIPELGGQLFTMPTKSPMGTSFVFTDCGGAVLAAFEVSDLFSVPSSSRSNEIVWQRLYSGNHEKTRDFYGALFDWRVAEKAGSQQIFTDQSDIVIGDLGVTPSWLEADTWVYFVGVGSVTEVETMIEKMSGSVIERTIIGERSAIVTKDSQGGVIGFVDCEQ